MRPRPKMGASGIRPAVTDCRASSPSFYFCRACRPSSTVSATKSISCMVIRSPIGSVMTQRDMLFAIGEGLAIELLGKVE